MEYRIVTSRKNLLSRGKKMGTQFAFVLEQVIDVGTLKESSEEKRQSRGNKRVIFDVERNLEINDVW